TVSLATRTLPVGTTGKSFSTAQSRRMGRWVGRHLDHSLPAHQKMTWVRSARRLFTDRLRLGIQCTKGTRLWSKTTKQPIAHGAVTPGDCTSPIKVKNLTTSP